MGAIQWDSNLETGVELMDEQHKRLVEIYNELYAALMKGKAHKQMNEILAELIDYTSMHFEAEESHMAAADYDDLEHHRTEHRQLLEKVHVFQKKMQMDQERISKSVMKFLEFWLKSHIQGTDMAFATWESKRSNAEEGSEVQPA